jgi:hypothetical protein
MTDTTELDALAQAIADAETRAGREISEDEALAVARAIHPFSGYNSRGVIGLVPWIVSHVTIARAAYAAGRGSRDEEAAALASWQCIHMDGVTGLTHDERGHATCAKDARIAELEASLARSQENGLYFKKRFEETRASLADVSDGAQVEIAALVARIAELEAENTRLRVSLGILADADTSQNGGDA